MQVPSQRSAPSAPLLGKRTPRILTPPLRPLTPDTSKGFEVIEFARDVLGEPLLPWQAELMIRALELRPDGSFRFRTVLVLVARQQGKTFALRTLALWRLYLDGARLILSVAQSLDIAREAWKAGIDAAQSVTELSEEIDTVRMTNGDQEVRLSDGARWRIGAATRSAGRGLSVDLLVMDELREQRSWDAWSALSKTISARPNGQVWAITNAGDDQSVVLNHLRDSAMSGEDDSLAIFEWSAPEGCDLDDTEAWAQANPALGHTVTEQAIRSSLSTDPPAVFRTEVLCQRVDVMESAVDYDAWKSCADANGSLDGLRDRVALCVDVSLDREHATLVAAAVASDGRVRVEVVAAWSGKEATQQLRTELPGWVARVKPQAFGWFPGGPAAAISTDLQNVKRTRPIKAGEVSAVCQELAEQAGTRRVLHPDDPLLNAQMGGAQRSQSGEGWRFTRKGAGHVDAVYATAGAVHLARGLKPKPRTTVIYA